MTFADKFDVVIVNDNLTRLLAEAEKDGKRFEQSMEQGRKRKVDLLSGFFRIV